MQRRGFLQAFVAAAAGLAGGGTSLASAHRPPRIAATKPQVAVTADTSGFSAGVNEARAMVLEMLKECRAVTYSHASGVYGSPSRLSVTYRHAPRDPRTEVDEAVAAILGERPHAIRSANVSSRAQDVDVFDANSLLYGYTGLQELVSEIEVEYIV
jgi:hypothetical protein